MSRAPKVPMAGSPLYPRRRGHVTLPRVPRPPYPPAPAFASLARLIPILLGIVAAFSGCSTSCPGTSANSGCETTCTDAACEKVRPGSKCFQNTCVTPCASSATCGEGLSCKRAQTDSGEKGSFCVGKAPAIGGADGAPCSANTDCATAYGYACLAGTCAYTCVTHDDCGSSGSCAKTDKDVAGNTVRLCAPDTFPRAPGQFGTACPNGNECDCPKGACTAETNWTCVSAGVGDIDAYCTERFCSGDTDCPSGFFCDARASDAPPCADTCPGITGDASGDCVPATDIGADKNYRCAPAGFLIVHECRKREFCNTCESDLDCLAKPNQICAKDESGNKICTILCDPGLNSCPWGNAATCGVWDQDLGVPTCEHRFGKCIGTGKSCEPCVQETDCPNGFCTSTKFTGERYCVDMTVTCSCPADTPQVCLGGGCPESPGQRTMNCYGGSQFKGTPVENLCIGAPADQNESASKESCWPRL